MSDNTQGIPKEWKVTELGDSAHFELIMGQSPPSSSYNEGGKGIPFMQGNAEFGVIYPKPSKCTTEPTKIAQKNDILISVRAPVGELNMADSRLCLGRGLGAIRVKEGDCWFYFYYFQTIKTKIQNMSKGSTFKAIDKDQVERITVPLPPLPEQQKIAEILSTVDDAIQKSDEIITKTQRLKKGMMDKLLTQGIRHKEFKETELGRIPKEWEVHSIESFSDVETGSTPLTSKKEYWNGSIPWMSSGEIHQGVIRNVSKFITKLGMENSNTTLLPRNTIAIAMNGQGKTRGSVGILGIETTCNQSIAGIIIKKDVYPLYLYYHLQSRYRELRNLSGAGRSGLNLGLIKSVKVAIPPLSEQQKIAEILTTVDDAIELERKRKAKLERVKKGLMDELLTGRTRVN